MEASASSELLLTFEIASYKAGGIYFGVYYTRMHHQFYVIKVCRIDYPLKMVWS